jgi:rod shape-determining protein MreC
MLQLINFLRKYRVATLFVFLEFIALVFIIRSHSFHYAKYLNSANIISGGIHQKINDISTYFSLDENNEILLKENVKLKNQLEYFQKRDSLGEIVKRDTAQYEYIPAKVINNSYAKRNNVLTLNKGEEDGVKPNMGVVLSNGIIGIVLNTSKHYATVLSVLNNQARFNVKLTKSHHYGSLEWNGEQFNQLNLVDFPIQANVKVGDSIISGGKSVLFPLGIPIGVVTEVSKGDNAYKEVVLAPFVDYSALYEVYVIENKMAKEQIELESRNE